MIEYFNEEQNDQENEHLHFMEAAFNEAQKALENDEVPIGAVVVHKGVIIGRGFNQIETLQDATAHAETIALGAAASSLGSWRLHECTLYVTLEPCMMCLGASLQSRVDTIVYGASDNRFGALEDKKYQKGAEAAYRRWPNVIGGIMQEECKALIQHFFQEIRKRNKEKGKRYKGAYTETNE